MWNPIKNMSIGVAIGAVRLGHRPQELLQRAADRRQGDPWLGSPFFFPANPGPPLEVVLKPGTHRPASPGRHGDGSRAMTGPRNDPGPIPPSSAGSLAPPASGSSTAAPLGCG